MDHAGMGVENILNNQRGQSLVEYMLVILVSVSLAYSILKSDMVQDYFGENGTFVTNFKSELEYSYRHGIRGRAKNIINYNSPNHDSYRKNGDTRFFGPLQRYPQ